MQTRSFINKANLKNIKIKKCQTNKYQQNCQIKQIRLIK